MICHSDVVLFWSVSESRHMGAAKELGIANIITRGLHKIVKLMYHQITCFCNGKTETISPPTPNFDFVSPYLLERTDKICEMIESI